MTPACRFFYSYTPPGFIDPCCVPKVCATNQTLSSISCLTTVVNGMTQTTESSLLLSQQQQLMEEEQKTATNQALTYTSQNAATITQDIYGQMLQIRMLRYQPYQPYIPPVIPPSVMELQMRTVNVGVPVPVMTIAKCKGSQFVTT